MTEPHSAGWWEEAGILRGEGERISVAIDTTTGSIVGLANRLTGQRLIADAADGRPWQLLHYGSRSRFMEVHPRSDLAPDEATPAAFAFDVDGAVATLSWQTSDAHLSVEVRAVIADEGHLELWPAVLNRGGRTPETLAYPQLGSPAELSPGGDDDILVFPAHSGWQIRRPLQQGLTAGVTPAGWRPSGCSLQAMGYLEQGVGGFYLATHDPHSTFKGYEFGPDGIRFLHNAWDLRPGAGMRLDYPVVVDALVIGDWYEVVDRYRVWALHDAPWTTRGPKWGRSDDEYARWLHEEVGVSVWRPPSSVDWSPWYRWIADVAGTPVHFVPGWDWAATRPQPVGFEGWFPANFHPANVEAWKGHRVTPDSNDEFISIRAGGFMERWEPALMSPYVIYPYTMYSDPGIDWLPAADSDSSEPVGPLPDPQMVADVPFFLCPATDETRELHTWRHTELIVGSDMDGVYNDVSSGGIVVQLCLRNHHEHTPGWSRQIVDAYDELNRRTAESVLAATGRYPAQGSEMMTESMIGWLDFYVGRAVAGPHGIIEAAYPAPEDPPGGTRELIPLFEAVYHDYGPVRQDGWLQLSRDIGEVFFWVGARLTIQWGGMLSLEYSAHYPERIPGVERGGFIGRNNTVYESSDLPEADPAKLAFVRELATARTGFGNRYLGYGRIIRSTGIDSPSIAFDYRHHYDLPYVGGPDRVGTWQVPQVLEGCWMDPLGNVGCFLVNLHPDAPRSVELDVDLERWGLGHASIAGVEIRGSAGQVTTMPAPGSDRFTIPVDLPPRKIMLVELPTEGREPARP